MVLSMQNRLCHCLGTDQSSPRLSLSVSLSLLILVRVLLVRVPPSSPSLSCFRDSRCCCLSLPRNETKRMRLFFAVNVRNKRKRSRTYRTHRDEKARRQRKKEGFRFGQSAHLLSIVYRHENRYIAHVTDEPKFFLWGDAGHHKIKSDCNDQNHSKKGENDINDDKDQRQ